MTTGVTLLIGDSSDSPLANADQIEVVERWGQPVRYHLHYGVDIVDGDFPKLVADELGPGTEISVFVSTDSGTQCLVKGPVYSHDITLKNGGTGSALVVHGGDNSIKMARVDKSEIWLDANDTSVVRSILSSHGILNVEADETDTTYSEEKHPLVQRSDDLRFIRKLARRNGFLFWLSYDDDAQEIGHFRKPQLTDLAEAELIINLEDANVDQINISWDVERPDTVTGSQLDLNSLSEIDGQSSDSGLEILGSDSLAAIRGEEFTTHLSLAADDAGDLQSRARGALTESNWFIRAACATSTHRLRDVIRSHQVVNLRGAGSRYSGHYFVTGVSHLIDNSAHLMEITMVRNGW